MAWNDDYASKGYEYFDVWAPEIATHYGEVIKGEKKKKERKKEENKYKTHTPLKYYITAAAAAAAAMSLRIILFINPHPLGCCPFRCDTMFTSIVALT